MSFKKRILFFIVGIGLSVLTANFVFAAPAAAQTESENKRVLDAVATWVNGRYDSAEQADKDYEMGIPDAQQHRLMHQLFAPVDVPFLDGVVIYQQSSMDGSEDPEWITRKGLLQFYVSPETGQVHQRELSFKEDAKFFNVHRKPELLKGLSLDDLRWRTKCDFKLVMEAGGQAVSGPMDFGPCIMKSPSSGENIVAEDEIRITPNEYWFLGRYLDADGNIVWGTESDEMNKLKRVSVLEESP